MQRAVFTDAVMSASVTSAIIETSDINATGIQMSWVAGGSAPTGTFVVDVTNDPAGTASPTWTPLTGASAYVSHGTAAPAGAAGDCFIEFLRDVKWEMMRVRYVRSGGGDGTTLLNGKVSLKAFRAV